MNSGASLARESVALLIGLQEGGMGGVMMTGWPVLVSGGRTVTGQCCCR